MDVINLCPNSEGVWTPEKPWLQRKLQSFEFWQYLFGIVFFVIIPGMMDSLSINGSDTFTIASTAILMAAVIIYATYVNMRRPRKKRPWLPPVRLFRL